MPSVAARQFIARRLGGRRLAAVLLLLTAGLLTIACERSGGPGPGVRAQRPPHASTPPSPTAFFVARHLARSVKVVDGDTLRLPDRSLLRLGWVDTEEDFHDEGHRRSALADFEGYVARQSAESGRPAKYPTPAGRAATLFLRDLLSRGRTLRIERDAAVTLFDAHGRLLGHAVLESPGGELLLAEEILRAGHSPYFVKYGRSVRYGERYEVAEARARNQRRGIWGSQGPGHYPDYPQRLAWWHERADQVDRWRREAHRHDHVTLELPSAPQHLASLAGREATVFGLLADVWSSKRSSRKILFLEMSGQEDFPLVVFDPRTFARLDLDRIANYYVRARGRIRLWKGEPEIVIRDPGQISTLPQGE